MASSQQRKISSACAFSIAASIATCAAARRRRRTQARACARNIRACALRMFWHESVLGCLLPSAASLFDCNRPKSAAAYAKG
jgi:hypothetical protein